MLFKTLLISLVSVAAAESPILFRCVSEIPADACTALAEHAKLAPRGVNCKVVTGVLGILKNLGGPATSFCSSYLHVPSATTVFTTTTPATSTTTSITTTTTTKTVITPIGFKKRGVATPYRAPVYDLRPRNAPGPLGNYAAAEISSACSCLSIQPKATTVVTTAPTPVTTIGSTVTALTTFSTCTANGGPCNCGNPGACCGAACSCNDGNGHPVSTCFGF